MKPVVISLITWQPVEVTSILKPILGTRIPPMLTVSPTWAPYQWQNTFLPRKSISRGQLLVHHNLSPPPEWADSMKWIPARLCTPCSSALASWPATSAMNSTPPNSPRVWPSEPNLSMICPVLGSIPTNPFLWRDPMAKGAFSPIIGLFRPWAGLERHLPGDLEVPMSDRTVVFNGTGPDHWPI